VHRSIRQTTPGSASLLPALAAVLLLAVLAVAPARALAQDAPPFDREEAVERLRLALDSLVAELQLTGEQEPRVRSILEASYRERVELARELREIRDGGAGRRAKIRQMRDLRDRMDEHRDETRQQLAEVLTEAQLATYDRWVEERRAEMRQRIRGARRGGPPGASAVGPDAGPGLPPVPRPGGHALPSEPGPDARAQIESVEAAVRRFEDPEAAREAGFRHGGLSTPTMGQHWTLPGRVGDGEIALEEPEGLMYADVEGETTLVGVFYAVRQPASEPAPEGFAGDADAWHRHAMPGMESGLTMLHLWFVPAHRGPFTDHNHWLPFLAAGLPLPPQTLSGDPEGRRLVAEAALGLAEVGPNWTLALRITERADAGARAEIRDHRAEIAALVPELRAALEDGDEAGLRSVLEAVGREWRQLYEIELSLLDGRAERFVRRGVANVLAGHVVAP
jgi:Spy/CpxP family protein refolding chaperone